MNQIEASKADGTCMYWEEVSWTWRDKKSKPWQWMGYILGVRCASITLERSTPGKKGGYLVYARMQRVGMFPTFQQACEEAMFAATEAAMGVSEFFTEAVRDYPYFRARVEPKVAKVCGDFAGLVMFAACEWEKIQEERAEVIKASQSKIDAFNEKFSARGRAKVLANGR